MTNKNGYPRMRNEKLEGGSLPCDHIFLEEKNKYGFSVKVQLLQWE